MKLSAASKFIIYVYTYLYMHAQLQCILVSCFFLMHAVLQTEFMRDMMTKYRGNVICTDLTHSTNMYDFLLVSVMIIDKHGEGISFAWAVSNHEDTSTS